MVFTSGRPLSQKWLHKRIWVMTLERLALRVRGHHNVRDSLIAIALSAGEARAGSRRCSGTSVDPRLES